MTTVCYKGGVLAVDSMVTANGLKVGFAQKVRVMRDGSVMAHAGILADAEVVFDWVERGKPRDDKPKMDDSDFEAVQVFPDGRVVWYHSNLVSYTYREHLDFWAFGSGESLALGAMAAGATATEACEIACDFDTHSCVPVNSVTVAASVSAAAE